MGDNLAQVLYEAHRSSAPDINPVWGNLDSWERESWERVATVARQTMARRFVDSIDAAFKLDRSTRPAEVDELRKRWDRP